MAVVPDMDRTDSCCCTCSNSDQTAIEMNLNNINFMAELGYVHGSDMLVGLMVEDAFSPLGHSKTCTVSNKAETKERAVKPTLAEKAKRLMPASGRKNQ